MSDDTAAHQRLGQDELPVTVPVHRHELRSRRPSSNLDVYLGAGRFQHIDRSSLGLAIARLCVFFERLARLAASAAATPCSEADGRCWLFPCSAHRRHRWLAPSPVGVVHEPEDNQHPCGLHRSLRCRRLQLRRHAEWRPCVDPSSFSGCSRGASADRAFRVAARSSRMLLRLDAQRLWQDRHHCGRLVLPSRRLSGRCFAEVRRPLLHAALQIEPGRSSDIVLRTDRVQHIGCRTAGLAAERLYVRLTSHNAESAQSGADRPGSFDTHRRRCRWLAPAPDRILCKSQDYQHAGGLYRSLRCWRLHLRRSRKWRPCVTTRPRRDGSD